MEKSKKSINVEGGFLFCGGWNFSKSVSVGPTFIRDESMRLLIVAQIVSLVLDTVFETNAVVLKLGQSLATHLFVSFL